MPYFIRTLGEQHTMSNNNGTTPTQVRYRGLLSECLKQLGTTNADMVARFIKYGNLKMNATTRRWLTGRSAPLGAAAIKARIGLRAVGFDADGMESYPQDLLDLSQLVTHDALSIEEIAERLRVTPQSVLRVLRNSGMRTDARKKELKQIIDEYQPLMEEVNARFGTTRVSPAADVQAITSGLTATKPEAITTIIAAMAAAMIPMIDLALSDSFSADHRAKLRHKAGEFGLFDLKNKLARLCSEQARREL
jgi:hypothetical protein